MIERNLGNIERVFRLLAGLLLGAWAVTSTQMNGIEWFVMAISVLLIMNGIFSRCYLWYVLDIDSTDQNRPKPASRACSG